jgi:hypothetical protein
MLNQIMEIYQSLEGTDDQKNHILPTELYKEGWMLKLVLKWFSDHRNVEYKISMNQNSNWFSEALLPTKFSRINKGDKLAETSTHADGIYGDFSIGDKGKGDVVLIPDCKQFVVTEAKMYSKYAESVTHAPDYNQAARNVACMCYLVSRTNWTLEDIGFYTFLPMEQIENEKTFAQYSEINHIKNTVLNRVNLYKGREDYDDKNAWYENDFLPFCDHIKIKLISWEEIISIITIDDDIYGDKLNEFYKLCKKYNLYVKDN